MVCESHLPGRSSRDVTAGCLRVAGCIFSARLSYIGFDGPRTSVTPGPGAVTMRHAPHLARTVPCCELINVLVKPNINAIVFRAFQTNRQEAGGVIQVKAIFKLGSCVTQR